MAFSPDGCCFEYKQGGVFNVILGGSSMKSLKHVENSQLYCKMHKNMHIQVIHFLHATATYSNNSSIWPYFIKSFKPNAQAYPS